MYLQDATDRTVTHGDGTMEETICKMTVASGGGWQFTTRPDEQEPLRLLDLPLDVLEAIVKEVTHTNDLTALALTNSTLHRLVIPHIYARFDIVWPDTNATMDSRTGVDALTYGLATLVMAQNAFSSVHYQHRVWTCERCGHHNPCQHNTPMTPKVRRGNHFAQFTRKFSLGNGPDDWVREYLITKEAGKMLGTLVALAVARMRNLEAFTWDMPTGVLRDVWLALASLADRDDAADCKLERIWVRWHDNREHAALVSSVSGTLPTMLPGSHRPRFQIPAYPRVEFPTFSVLPSLKSITVLDIDEFSYLEELSVLIERSVSGLKELRIGLATHAQHSTWAKPTDDSASTPRSTTYPTSPASRYGGVLGVLTSCLDQSLGNLSMPVNVIDTVSVQPLASIKLDAQKTGSAVKISTQELLESDTIDELSATFSAHKLSDDGRARSMDDHVSKLMAATPTRQHPEQKKQLSHSPLPGAGKGNVQKLELCTLALERVYLHNPILFRMFDWSKLRSITLLGCGNHERLWKALRRKFTPLGTRRESSISERLSTRLSMSQSASPACASPNTSQDYALAITKIQIDCVSTAFLAFVKDTLAPDTLESLFLHQCESYRSVISIDQIYKYAVRRHRHSLKKLLVNSDVHMADGSRSTDWRRWAFCKDLITCITNGRMQLRELSMSIEYRDWHYFLQRLPNAASLRSLHITHIAEHVNGRIDSRDTAQQIVDVVALRSELELCYIAIQDKCFEVLELSPSHSLASSTQRAPLNALVPHHQSATDLDSDVSDNDDQTEDDDDNDDDEDNLVAYHNEGASDFDEDGDHSILGADTDGDNDEDEGIDQRQNRGKVFRLREIIFYDDKVSIFKARHGRI